MINHLIIVHIRDYARIDHTRRFTLQQTIMVHCGIVRTVVSTTIVHARTVHTMIDHSMMAHSGIVRTVTSTTIVHTSTAHMIMDHIIVVHSRVLHTG